MKNSGFDLRLLSIAKDNQRTWDDQPNEVVIVRGHTFAIIVINHPWPYWRQDLRSIRTKVKAAKEDAKCTLHKRIEQSRADRKANRDWQVHIKSCIELVKREPKVTSSYIYVTNSSSLKAMVNQLAGLPDTEPYIGFDLEANKLGHQSPLCIIQIRDFFNSQTFIVDLLVLGKKVFSTKAGKASLRSILEDAKVEKLIFDVRQDSCALYGNMGIKLKGMLDLQVMDLLRYRYAPSSRIGLQRCCQPNL